MDNKYIEFENGSSINCIDGEESVKSQSSKIIYYSDAYKKYHTVKGILAMCQGLKWYQKLYMVVLSKWLDFKDCHSPYSRMIRRFRF